MTLLRLEIVFKSYLHHLVLVLAHYDESDITKWIFWQNFPRTPKHKGMHPKTWGTFKTFKAHYSWTSRIHYLQIYQCILHMPKCLKYKVCWVISTLGDFIADLVGIWSLFFNAFFRFPIQKPGKSCSRWGSYDFFNTTITLGYFRKDNISRAVLVKKL